MTGTPRVLSLDGENPLPEGDDAAFAAHAALAGNAEAFDWVEHEAPAPARWRRWLAPALCGAALVAWTVLFVLTNIPGAGTPQQWLGWIEAWSGPVAVLALVWLLAHQLGAGQAQRFSGTARQLQREAALLESRLAAVNSELSIAREFLAAQSRELETLGRLASERLTKSAGELTALITDNTAQISTIGTVSSAALDNMERLRGQLPVLANSARDVANTIANAGRMAGEQVGELSHGMERLESLGSNGEARIAALRDTLAEAGLRGEDLAAHVGAANAGLAATIDQIGTFHEALKAQGTAHSSLLETMRQSLAALDTESTAFTEKANHELTGALARLHAAALSAGSAIREQGGQAVAEIASRLGEESIAAIERAMRNEAASLTGRLEQAAAHAAGVTREAGDQIAEQIGQVEVQLAALQARVAEARARAEAQVDNSFARRAALITEALNSNAIDIAKALDSQVADPAWAAYLKGDRGIFTRAAVRLLDGGENRAIARLYRNDDTFRDRVSHYIHDFEGMLRQILATRDGEALGVTLLSSDMGKLYVALAQAIERLRS